MSFEKPAGRSGPDNIYPLAALAGQDRMKLALLLLVVDPRLGGVLLVGEKGTAKSTAVRALAELLPPLDAVQGCRYNCDPDLMEGLCPDCRRRFKLEKTPPRVTRPTPFLTLPLGATEDRLAGGLDLELTARTGRPELSPGLLGQANRGFLYVDEINLLEPYLGHLLLDAAESGWVRVEREGLSLRHPARIALIGTMNPEEGSLGPQLADRFALTVRVIGETGPDVRAGIVRRRLAFETDPARFRGSWAKETKALRQRLTKARQRLSKIEITPQAQNLISDLVREHRSKGHRGDLALARAARALAAWQDAPAAGEKQVLAMADLALASRRTEAKKTRVKAAPVRSLTPPPNKRFEEPYIPPSEPEFVPAVPGEPESGQPQVLRLFVPNEKFEIVTPASRREQGPRERSGRRAARQTSAPRGRYYRSSPERLGRPLALDATFRAAAPHQPDRRASKSSALVIRKHDFREKVFRQKTGRLVLFVVDASGSVGSLDRMSEAKAAVLSLLGESYRKRDRVGLIAFHGFKAKVLLYPTNSVEMAGRLLEDLPSGGKTPLAAALAAAHRLAGVEMARDPGLTPLIVIMTDGRPNITLTPGLDPFRETLDLAARFAMDNRLRFLLVDTDNGHYADYKLTRDLAEKLRAPRLTIEDLRHGEFEVWLEQMV